MSKSARNRAKRNALTKREVPWGGILFFTAIGLVAAVAIGFAFVQSRPVDASSIKGLVQEDGLGREHTAKTVQYKTSPPMGGDHDPVWQNCDGQVYSTPLRNENAVHALEHGAVWITYRPDLPGDQVHKLGDKVKNTGYTMMSPYPGLDSPIVLTAWGRQVKVQDISDSRVDAFLRAFVKGPQTPEPGAACNGGKGAA